MKKILLSALLALAGLTGAVHAQVAAAYGDLILGFRATSGTGQNINLEVDLGSITQFSGLTAGTHFTVAKLAVADLTSLYGANWASRTDLFWGVVGTTGRTAVGPGAQPVGTLWATKPELVAGTQTGPWTRGSTSAQFVGSAAIEPLFISAPGSLNGHAATANSTAAAAISASLSGSYSSQDTVQAGESFDFFNPSIDGSTNLASVSYVVSDLYELRPGTGASTYLGSFGLTAAGTLVFSSTASFFAQGLGNETFTTQPASATVVSGSTVVFTAAASGTPAPTYQWYLNGGAVSGATNARLVIPAADGTKAGTYTVVATNSSGSATSNSATLAIAIAPATNNPGRLINLSVLSNISGSLAMGFVTGGSGTSGQQNLLIRATGPALGAAPFNIGGVMTDPTLKVTQQSNSNTVAQNSGWGTPSTNVAIVQTADNATGAFALTNTASLDSALVANLPSVTGGYSATVASATHGTGYSLAEVYDDTATYTATTPRLVNLSCLTQLPASGGINVGFVIGGTTAKTVLIRASGPTLAAAPFNIPGSMPDPQLTVAPLSSSTTVLATNAGWGGDTALSSTATAVGAFALTSLTSKDSATIITLQPNIPYTVAVTSATGAGGWVLVEIYEVP